MNQSGTLLVGPRWKTKGDQAFAVRTPQYKGQRMLPSVFLKRTSIGRLLGFHDFAVTHLKTYL